MTLLAELSPRTRFYTVNVTVIVKNRAMQPVGKSRYQRLVLKDEKGTTMDATIYGDDIATFNDIIEKNVKYEISNAYISRVNTNFPGNCGDYQVTISSRTLVRRLDSTASTSAPTPKYNQLIAIPHDPYTNAQYDVVGIVLYVGPPKAITGASGFLVNVSQLVITNDSTSEAVIVSLWNDLAENEAVKLATEAAANPIVSFTDLHASKFQEFSLATSRSTIVGFNPTGERVDALKAWKAKNASAIKQRMTLAAEARSANCTPLSSTISEINSMTVSTVTYARKVRLTVFIPDFKAENVNLFFGCKLCGKKSDQEKQTSFECEFCGQLSIAEPRYTLSLPFSSWTLQPSTCALLLFFNFHATDGSGTKLFSTYNKLAEQLLEVGVDALLKMTPEEKQSFYNNASVKFRTQPTVLELAPIPPPTARTQVIKWTVKAVVFE